VLTVIIPAHNESRVIGRLLDRIARGVSHPSFEIIVVANGCTDDTAAVAAAYGDPVRVLEIPLPSKREALKVGDEAATGFPRVYVDADVELDATGLWSLARALDSPGVLAAGPARDLDLTHSVWPVRWYYDVWQRLPQVRHGLFGRGVVAVSEAGHRRIAALPALLADDLAASLSFGPAERRIVPAARALVHAPRSVSDLVRRRVRVVTGVNQIERSAQAPRSSERTSRGDLLAILTSNPVLVPKIAIFLAVTILARRKGKEAARKEDYTTWLRDESSRH
jgi:glycosyltransferase involved in cell wall biosynthesis